MNGSGATLATGAVPSARDLIHPHIDPDAQKALRRLMIATPDAGFGMFDAVRSGRLAGIYGENQQVPALRAQTA